MTVDQNGAKCSPTAGESGEEAGAPAATRPGEERWGAGAEYHFQEIQ